MARLLSPFPPLGVYESPAADRDPIWQAYGKHMAGGHVDPPRGFPDFFLIGGGRSGTAWLRSALARHPGVNVGPDHEIHYFTKDWETRSLDDYCRSFDESGEGMRGDFTPVTALLPAQAIAAIRDLNPNLKVLYAMRRPVDHAWALARHYIRYRGFEFAELNRTGTLSLQMLMKFFVSDFAIASSDHAAVLERWLSVFPSDQVFAYFVGDAANDGATLVEAVQAFLGLDPILDAERLLPTEPVNAGLPEELPEFLAPWLRTLWRSRTLRLAALIEDRLGKSPPDEWQAELAGSVASDDQILFEGPTRYVMKGGVEEGGLFVEPETGRTADYLLDLTLAAERRADVGSGALADLRQSRILSHMNADLFFQPPITAADE